MTLSTALNRVFLNYIIDGVSSSFISLNDLPAASVDPALNSLKQIGAASSKSQPVSAETVLKEPRVPQATVEVRIEERDEPHMRRADKKPRKVYVIYGVCSDTFEKAGVIKMRRIAEFGTFDKALRVATARHKGIIKRVGITLSSDPAFGQF